MGRISLRPLLVIDLTEVLLFVHAVRGGRAREQVLENARRLVHGVPGFRDQRPGRRSTTCWMIHSFPSGSSNETYDE